MSQSIDYQEEISKCRTMEDITGPNGLIQRIIKDAVEQILGREVDEYISSEKEKGNSASRNGSSHKTVKTAYGNIGVDVPRLREPGFEPEIIKKRAVVEDGLESRIISMYAKGMTVRDISEHIQALYGIELSAASISNITDKISDESKDWYSRTLDSFYPVIFLDAVHFKVREEGRIVTKAAYVALGINGEGYKDILGIWIGENEGAKFWLKVCNELKNRGVQDILIVCIDGLKGFPDAIKTVFPETRIQLCIIHQIVSAPRDTVWLYYHISAILKTIKYCRKRPEAPHLFPGYSFGSILLEDFLPRASVLPAAPDDTGDPVPAYA